MKMNAYLGLALTLGLAACGDAASKADDEPTGGGNPAGIPVNATVDITGDGLADGTALDTNGDGVPESIDRNGDGKADGLLPSGAKVVAGGTGGQQAGNNGGTGSQTSNNNGNTPISGVGDDGGTMQGGTSGVVVTTQSTVFCGDSEKMIDVSNKYSCCDSLSGDTWAAPAVKAGCNMYSGSPFGATTDAVGSECDGKDDCGSNFCCFVYNTMGPPPGANNGRAHGRKCMTQAGCNDTQAFSGASAMFSCQTDADCPQPSQKCVAEPAGGLTSSGKAGRPWVKICQ